MSCVVVHCSRQPSEGILLFCTCFSCVTQTREEIRTDWHKPPELKKKKKNLWPTSVTFIGPRPSMEVQGLKLQPILLWNKLGGVDPVY